MRNGDFVETYNGEIYSCMIINDEPVGFGLDSRNYQPFNQSRDKGFEPRFVYRPNHMAWCNPFRFRKEYCKLFHVKRTINLRKGNCVKTNDGIYLYTGLEYIPLNTTIPYRGEIIHIYGNYETIDNLLKDPDYYVVPIRKDYELYD